MSRYWQTPDGQALVDACVAVLKPCDQAEELAYWLLLERACVNYNRKTLKFRGDATRKDLERERKDVQLMGHGAIKNRFGSDNEHRARLDWLNALLEKSPEGRKRLAALRNDWPVKYPHYRLAATVFDLYAERYPDAIMGTKAGDHIQILELMIEAATKIPPGKDRIVATPTSKKRRTMTRKGDLSSAIKWALKPSHLRKAPK